MREKSVETKEQHKLMVRVSYNPASGCVRLSVETRDGKPVAGNVSEDIIRSSRELSAWLTVPKIV